MEASISGHLLAASPGWSPCGYPPFLKVPGDPRSDGKIPVTSPEEAPAVSRACSTLAENGEGLDAKVDALTRRLGDILETRFDRRENARNL
jgi:hypothetical protein